MVRSIPTELPSRVRVGERVRDDPRLSGDPRVSETARHAPGEGVGAVIEDAEEREAGGEVHGVARVAERHGEYSQLNQSREIRPGLGL